MRIAHVVTLLSSSGAFGGPLSVAGSQVAELANRGHDVVLFAGWDGLGAIELPQGARTTLHRAYQLVPGTGFPGLFAPGLLADLARTLDTFDVAHIHLGRDLITSTASMLARLWSTPYVVQPHGMIVPDSRARTALADRLVTRRVLYGASRVFSLTPAEDDALTWVAPGLRLQRLPNGIHVGHLGDPIKKADPPEVLFCARLHPRKRVLAFVDMAEILIERGVRARFAVVGPDEGDLTRFRARVARLGIADWVSYEGPLAPNVVRDRLRRTDVFVLPSANEPFPMTVLEALAAGTPAVITDSCQIADELERRQACLVTDGSPEGLADAVQRLLTEPSEAALLRSRGFVAVGEAFGIGPVVDRLERVYRELAHGGATDRGRT